MAVTLITAPAVEPVTLAEAKLHYRLEISFVSGGNTYEAWCEIRAQR